MDIKKIIVALIVVGIVFWIFWFMGANNSVTSSLRKGLGLENAPASMTETESEVQPISLAGHSQLGNYLTDVSGMTLYVTTKTDCTGNCLTVWPPYVANGSVSAVNGRLGTAQNEDAGVLQYTWNGKFLYYYEQDKKPGDVFGHGVGGVWFVAQ